MMPIRESFPDFYGRILPEIFDRRVPDEKLASCSQCAMACTTNTSSKRFRPDIKCCTYFPSLPNYLVGAIIANRAQMEEGYRKISTAIKARIGVYPSAVLPPRRYLALYQKGQKLGFGRSEGLVCPYYLVDGGLCSIWRYREAVCSTFFCKTVAGIKGKDFWAATMSYMTQLQKSLVMNSVFKIMGQPGWDALEESMSSAYSSGALSPDDLDLRVRDDVYSRKWGNWCGREEEFYVACFEETMKLTQADVAKLGGIEHAYRLFKVEEHYHAAMAVPEILRRAKPLPDKTPDGDHYVVALTKAERLFYVPTWLLEAFDGTRRTESILTEDDHDDGSGMSIVHALFHDGMLCAA